MSVDNIMLRQSIKRGWGHMKAVEVQLESNTSFDSSNSENDESVPMNDKEIESHSGNSHDSSELEDGHEDTGGEGENSELEPESACIDLEKGVLRIQDREVKFLSEHELPDKARDLTEQVDAATLGSGSASSSSGAAPHASTSLATLLDMKTQLTILQAR
ncbi:hypothetical protein JR316_0010864 [Psilocybe cubensis]|uniref:Uncharacterized protein n=1 Tax=Psilocybe cubensis TaxID=181762 RepID=A0ACB8GMR4_PSICU|nr:hypothetical protein JR316_0010864 [Psilocybe cubensis]KAH9476948.1 hypothetical protein JR316_0010864 [Psilocybe cubensis]